MKGFLILTKVNQCETVRLIESHFSIVLDTRNVPITAQSQPGRGVGGREWGVCWVFISETLSYAEAPSNRSPQPQYGDVILHSATKCNMHYVQCRVLCTTNIKSNQRENMESRTLLVSILNCWRRQYEIMKEYNKYKIQPKGKRGQ